MDAPKSLRLIDWSDSEALAANVRATVRRIVVDIPGRSFRVEPYAGCVILYRTDGETVTIEAAAVPRSIRQTAAGVVAETRAKRAKQTRKR